MANNKTASVYLSLVDDTSKAFKSIQSSITSTMSSLKTLGGAFLALQGVQYVFENIGASLEFADSLNDISERLGITVEKLSELDYIAGQSGTSFETLQKGYIKLSESIVKANEGSEEQIEIFNKLGISYKNADGSLRSTQSVLEDLAGTFENSKNDTNKMKIALDLLGKSGIELVPLLNNGKEGLENLRKEAEELGLIISSKTTAQIGVLGDTFDKVSKVSRNSMINLGATIAPALNVILNGFLEFKKETSKGLFDDNSIEETQAKIATFALNVLDAFDSVSKYIIGPLKIAFGIVAETVDFVFTESGKIVNDFAKVFADNNIEIGNIIGVLTTILKSLFLVFKGVFKSIIDLGTTFASTIIGIFGTVGKAIGGIAASVAAGASGNFEEAKNIIKDVGKTVFNDTVNGADKISKTFYDTFKNVGRGIGEGSGEISQINERMQEARKAIESSSTKIGDGVRKGFNFDKNVSDYQNMLNNINKINKDAKDKQSQTGLENNLDGTSSKKAKEDADKYLNEFLALSNKKIEAQIKENKYLSDLNTALYSSNFKTIEDYYLEKENLQKSENKFLIDAYNEQINLISNKLNSDKNNLKLQEQLITAQTKLKDAERNYTLESIKGTNERVKALEENKNKILQIQDEINKLLGVNGEEVNIDIKIRALREEFKTDLKTLDKINNLESILLVQNEFNKKLKENDELNRSIAITEKAIEIDRQNNITSIIKSYDNLFNVRTNQINELKKTLQELNNLPLDKLSTEQKFKIKEIENSIKELSSTVDVLAKQIDDVALNSFSTAFDDFISGAKSGEDAFKSFIGSVVKEISSISSKDLSQQIYKAILGDGENGSIGSYFSGKMRGGGLFGGSDFGSLFSGFKNFGSNLFSGISSLIGFDTGGILQAGQPVLTGEFGKEVFIPRTSGTLLSANKTDDFLNNSSKNITINNIQNITTPDSNSFNNSKGQLFAQKNQELAKYRRLL